jgi:hypothetical protein
MPAAHLGDDDYDYVLAALCLIIPTAEHPRVAKSPAGPDLMRVSKRFSNQIPMQNEIRVILRDVPCSLLGQLDCCSEVRA